MNVQIFTGKIMAIHSPGRMRNEVAELLRWGRLYRSLYGSEWLTASDHARRSGDSVVDTKATLDTWAELHWVRCEVRGGAAFYALDVGARLRESDTAWVLLLESLRASPLLDL